MIIRSYMCGACAQPEPQVDSSRSMYEYDGETQGAIRKIMYADQEYDLGLGI